MLIGVSRSRWESLPNKFITWAELRALVDGKTVIEKPVRWYYTSTQTMQVGPLNPEASVVVFNELPDPDWATFREGDWGPTNGMACLHAQNWPRP
jgi:hypothetical protein